MKCAIAIARGTQQAEEEWPLPLEHPLPVSRVLAAPRAVVELRTVRAGALIVFSAGHTFRHLRTDPRTLRRTLRCDVSVFTRRSVGMDDLQSRRRRGWLHKDL